MGKISVKDVSGCEKVLTINVGPEIVQKEYDQFYDGISKFAKVPGFRPGKVPKDVLAIHYKDKATSEVLSNLISSSLREALTSRDILPLDRPMIRNVRFESNQLSYEAHVDIRPKIKVGNYKGIKVAAKPLTVEESEIAAILKRIQESHTRLIPVADRAARIGDALICDYACLVEGKEVEKRTDDLISLRDKDYLEGFSNQLAGVNPGESRDVNVTFPADYIQKAYAGKSGVFKVSVKEIKEKSAPPLDDEFAKEAGEFKTLEELKTKIKRDIEEKKKQDQELDLQDALLQDLLKHSKFEVPARLVERRLHTLVDQSLDGLRRQGVGEEELKKKGEEFHKEYGARAERDVRVSFILDEIVQREKLQASDVDFKLKFEKIAQWAQKPAEEVEQYYQANPERKESLGIQIVNEKAIQLIRDHAVVKTQ